MDIYTYLSASCITISCPGNVFDTYCGKKIEKIFLCFQIKLYRESLDKRNLKLDEITREVQSLKDLISEYEVERQSLIHREAKLQTQVQNMEKEHHDKVNALRRELDAASLQYSELMLEKSKLANEKMALEQQMQKFNMREADVHRQVGEFKKEFGDIKVGLQQQLEQLESDKAQLEVRLRELERTNIDLYGRLMKMKNSEDGRNAHISRSLPSSPNSYNNNYGLRLVTSNTSKCFELI